VRSRVIRPVAREIRFGAARESAEDVIGQCHRLPLGIGLAGELAQGVVDVGPRAHIGIGRR
jgi:hypothetical protein